MYTVRGVYLMATSKAPLQHRSLIWFTICSSVVHALIMGVQALRDDMETGHLVGDVPALLIVAIVLALLMPRGSST